MNVLHDDKERKCRVKARCEGMLENLSNLRNEIPTKNNESCYDQ